MAVFYVFQGETYNHERNGQYVWSPQKNSLGRSNAGYTNMTHVHQGDFILHNNNAKIHAISIAKSDCYVSDQPNELETAEKTYSWNKEGYRIDCLYFDFDTPVSTRPMRDWLAAHYDKDSAFDITGKGRLSYMCHLADDHAIYILEESIRQQTKSEVIRILRAALSDIADDKESEYDSLEKEDINQLIDLASQTERPEWTGAKEAQAMTTSSTTGRPIPKRDPKRAADALQHAEYKCEYDPMDRTFLRKNGKAYTEPHHLIPISKYRDFGYSVDVMENIVSLCSHCHNLLHYGRIEDKEAILSKLFHERETALKNCGLDLTLEQLLTYYK